MPFDITLYELKETAELKIKDARGDADLIVDGQPVVFTLYGPGSKQFADASHKLQNAITTRAQNALRGKPVSNQAELMEVDQNERLISLTVSISKNFQAKPKEIYENRGLNYMRAQVMAFLDDAGNFMKDLPAS